MKRWFKIVYMVALFALMCFALTGCMDGELVEAEVEAGAETESDFMLWTHIGDSFEWFFNVFTPAYWDSVNSIWGLLSLAQECWEIPSLIGFIFALLMNVVVFIVALAVSAFLLICYLLAVVLFVGVFLFLLLLALFGALLSLFSLLVLSV